MKRFHFSATAAIVVLSAAGAARADRVVQIAVDPLLNARAVTTLTAGKLVTWTVGIDGGGLSDGYMTAAASKFHGDPATLKTLPDDGTFPADARHPEVALHFSNDAAATSQQTLYVRGAGHFEFAVPPATYSKMFLFVTSSEGSSGLRVSLLYADTTDVVSITVPDYYVDIPANDPVVFNLASNLPKWTQQNTVAEMNHHNLTGLEIHPMAGKVLSGIAVDKTVGGYLVFWGATGVATGIEIDAGTGVPEASSGDAAADVAEDVVVDRGNGGAIGVGGATATGSGGTVGSGGGGADGASAGGASIGTGGSTGDGGRSGEGSVLGQIPADAGCACTLRGGSSRSPLSLGIATVLVALGRRRRRVVTRPARLLAGRGAVRYRD